MLDSFNNIGPMKYFQCSIVVFDHCGTVFHPVTIITVKNIANMTYFCMVDVPTYYSIHTGTFRFMGDCLLEIINRIDCVFNPTFQIG